MKKHLHLLTLLLALAGGAHGATHNVSGSWANIPWASVNPGDIVRVSNITSGTLSPTKSGTSGNLITIVAVPGTTVRSAGMTLTNRDYLKFVGIEFTNTVGLTGGSSRNQFIDCVRIGSSSEYTFLCDNNAGNDYNVFRGITSSGLSSEQDLFQIFGHNNLIEYCRNPSQGGDFVRFFGNYNIARNNYLGPRSQYVSNHKDDIQTWQNEGGGDRNWTITNLWEANWSHDNNTQHSHGWLAQDTSATITMGGGIFRGNVIYWVYENLAEFNSHPWVRGYNNTALDLWRSGDTWPDNCIWIRASGTNPSYGGDHTWGNNSFTRCTYNNQGNPYQVQNSGATNFLTFNNHTYLSGSVSQGSGNINNTPPQFTNESTKNFMPQSGSPLRNAARYLTQASGGGSSSTTLVVDDSFFFSDGWGVAEGDKIKIGASGTPVRITAINRGTHTLTLAAARNWNDNDGVYVVGWDTEIGALPYRAGGLDISGTLSNVGTTWTVTPAAPECVRMVVFYLDDVPQDPIYDAPFERVVPEGVSVAAKLYARFAMQTMVANATPGGGGDVTAPIVVSATIPQADASVLVLAFNENVSIGSGGAGGLTLSASGGGVTLGTPTGGGTTTLTYPLSRAIANGETITRSYVQPGNGIEDAAGNDLGGFTNASVTNNVPAGPSDTLTIDGTLQVEELRITN